MPNRRAWRSGDVLWAVVRACAAVTAVFATVGCGSGAEAVLLDASHTSGWQHVGEGGFHVVGGVATSYGGRGALVYLARPFGDFTLSLQFRQNRPAADSGVFVRFPHPRGDATVPAAKGYQVEIGPVMNGSNQGLCAIDNLAAPIDDVPVRPPGEWNDLEITCSGRTVRVRLNGTETTTFTGHCERRGYVGLQNHDPTSIVAFRNVRVVEHAARP
jgi:hypothetical protein